MPAAPTTRPTREGWLLEVAHRLKPLFGPDYPAKFRVSVGFPSRGGTSRKNRTIGQCHYGGASADGHCEVFIHPQLADRYEVVATLAHELAHAALPPGTGHKGQFVRLIRRIGLEGKPTATKAGPVFKSRVDELLADLPVYPHAALAISNENKQSTRLLKVHCPDDGYIARVTGKWITELGAPICPGCEVPMEVDA